LTASPQDLDHHTYYMHYVALGNLTSRGRYSYRVQSGGSNASPSDAFSFRAPYSGSNGPGGATRIALFGDMGVKLAMDVNVILTPPCIFHYSDYPYKIYKVA
jgi:hypothetical protein